MSAIVIFVICLFVCIGVSVGTGFSHIVDGSPIWGLICFAAGIACFILYYTTISGLLF